MYFSHDTRTAAQGRDYMRLSQHTDKALFIPHEATTKYCISNDRIYSTNS